MRKLMLLAALLAMLMLTMAVPAMAEVGQGNEQETESGDVDQSFTVTGGGDNGSQCSNVNGTSNTGNLQTNTSLLQYFSIIEDFEQDEVGSNLAVGGEEASTVTCDQQVNQAASAG